MVNANAECRADVMPRQSANNPAPAVEWLFPVADEFAEQNISGALA